MHIGQPSRSRSKLITNVDQKMLNHLSEYFTSDKIEWKPLPIISFLIRWWLTIASFLRVAFPLT